MNLRDEDAKFLDELARHMTYNESKSEAVTKHRLFEISMRLSSRLYERQEKDQQTGKIAA